MVMVIAVFFAKGKARGREEICGLERKKEREVHTYMHRYIPLPPYPLYKVATEKPHDTTRER